MKVTTSGRRITTKISKEILRIKRMSYVSLKCGDIILYRRYKRLCNYFKRCKKLKRNPAFSLDTKVIL
jgi:hypothetical protein